MTDDGKLQVPLVPAAVAALKRDGTVEAGAALDRGRMERTMSQGIREEREDLKEAAEQNLNVILDVGLDGRVRWVSPSWVEVVGTDPNTIQGQLIADTLLEDKDAFVTAVDQMKTDNSRSQRVKFLVEMGPGSKLARQAIDEVKPAAEDEGQLDVTVEPQQKMILEGQGIMIYDRSSGGESHTMWMLRPSAGPREITIDLPRVLVDSLGVGAEVLAQHLTALAEAENNPDGYEPPRTVLCRICERQIPPWWFEKHSELCLQEHQAEMEVQLAQESLIEHRNVIVKILDALEARSNGPTSGEINIIPPAPAEYKGLPIGSSSNPSSGPSSGTASPVIAPNRSRDPSSNRLGHVRARSVAMRRPFSRIVEMVLDLCDTAIEINTPAIQDAKDNPDAPIRTLSEESEKCISQVMLWQKPSTHTLEQEPGLAALCADTEAAARLKVEQVLRHRQVLEYSERLRVEFTLLVQEVIDEAMHKAAKIAAGELSSSSDESEPIAEGEEDDGRSVTQEDGSFFPGSFDGPSSLSKALQNASDASLPPGRPVHLSAEVSTRSSSPKESVTPRSHRDSLIATRARSTSKRSSMYFESEAGDSDGGSVRSSMIAGSRRGDSPAPSERRLSRALSTRDRHRRSMILTGTTGTTSPPRQQSPSGAMPPPSPMRSARPAPLDRRETIHSPITSPVFSTGDFSSPPTSTRHHRRQSSAVSMDMRPPVSPRLTSVSQPQARAVPPSIKDFEIIKPISKGAFGSVYLSKKKSTGDYFAIKVLKKADMVAKNQVTNVKAERAIMMWQGESDFVAKLYWTFSSKDYLYLVMEYLNGGDCASLIKVLGGLPEDWARKYLAEVVLGLEHLHSRGIVHRDLKPDNLLIDQNGHLKLTDFGLSRMGLIGRQKRVLNSTAQDSAPDLLKQGPFARAMSMASSRSTSFDLQGYHSPSSTPQMTPDMASNQAFPSYFNLNRDQSWGREHSRHASGRSDSGNSESLQAMFGSFSLNETAGFPPTFGQQQQRRSVPEDEGHSEGSGSPDLFSPNPSVSHVGSVVGVGHTDNTPPSQQSMLPPPMALFDPDDSTRRFVGTPDYLAPETINGVGQDEMSDWWSLGCILFEFLYGYPPFHAETPERVFANILARRIDWPDEDLVEVSPEAKDLMNKLMALNPQERLGSNRDEKHSCGGAEVKSHPWFAGLNWETLLQDEAQFVPCAGDPENTEYFDSRGATLQSFAEELEDQASSPGLTPGLDVHARPHDPLSKVRTQVNSMKRGLMPLHIPPHVRESRNRRLSEPVVADDFGNFTFKNLPVLEKANKDVIQKLRAEAMQAQSKGTATGTTPSTASSPSPSLENSPVMQMPLKRQLSTSKGGVRPASPSTLGQANASPSRASQPSSPLMVSFVAGQHHERRKTSSTISSASQPSSGSLQPSTMMEIPRLSTGSKAPSSASSPIKQTRVPPPLAMSPSKNLAAPRPPTSTTSRARSHTVGSQEGGESPARDMYVQQKRRSGIFDMSPSSSDNEDSRANALLRVQRRRQSSRRMSQINMLDGPSFRPLDVLICEDHPVSHLVMEALLEKLRCRTITVGNGDEATRYAMSDVKFDIIMMEFKLPRINGADVARMIRDTKNANSHTPIVAVTGYLKELQAPHHFDAMIEKPPTTSKLAEVMSRLCNWVPPPPRTQTTTMEAQAVPGSGLRQESSRLEDSPSSTSSGYVHLPGATFRGSSREDSISSSFFGDVDSTMADDAPIIINAHHRQGDDWGGDTTTNTGLGISEDALVDATKDLSVVGATLPHLIQQQSAPPALQHTRILGRQRSAEKIKAKREGMERSKRLQGGESGDDEDEELGNVHVRARSPVSRGQRTSKLGVEMMRTNSRGSVISNPDIGSVAALLASTSPPTKDREEFADDHHATITPPEMFPTDAVGETVQEFDVNKTPQGPKVSVEAPTPRAPGKF